MRTPSRTDAIALATLLAALGCARYPTPAAATSAPASTPQPTTAAVTVTTLPATSLVLADSGEVRMTGADLSGMPTIGQIDTPQRALVTFFVVDTTGRVDRSSIRFGLGADQRSRDAACTALGRTTFEPIRRDGQLRAALVVLPYPVIVAGARAAQYAPSVEPFRRVIRREGIAAALDELATRPRC